MTLFDSRPYRFKKGGPYEPKLRPDQRIKPNIGGTPEHGGALWDHKYTSEPQEPEMRLLMERLGKLYSELEDNDAPEKPV